jgi:hypothetical protein
MRTGWTCSLAIVAAAAIGGFAPGLFAAPGQAPARRQPAQAAPRAGGGQPDLQGIWQVHNRAWGDLEDHEARPGKVAGKEQPFPTTWGVPAGIGVVEGGTIPYKPEALAQKKQNFANRMTLDPLAKCNMPGLPRATYLPLAFQIFQTPKYIAFVYEYSHTYRIVYTDGSKHIDGIEFWMGDSRGRWQGNTLVVDVTNFNDQTWLDAAGNFHSEAMHLVEHYTRSGPNTLQYEATIEDPKVFTRPWKIRMPIYRQTPQDYGDRLLEYECADLAEEEAGTFVVGNHQ